MTQSKWSNIEYIEVDRKPKAPSNLTITQINGHELVLSWTLNPEPDIEGYYILINQNGDGPDGPYELLKICYSWHDWTWISNLVSDTTYHFKMVTFDRARNNSTYSEVVSATTLDITSPEAPTGLSAYAISKSKIVLNWLPNKEQDVRGYNIFISDSNNDSIEPFYNIYTLLVEDPNYALSKSKLDYTYEVSKLNEKFTYHFKIQAFDEVPNNSSFSKVASATTRDETPPGAPTGLSIIDTNHNGFLITCA